MGYVQVYCTCYQCKMVFVGNPLYVPSLTIAGVKEPFCKSCIDNANVIRKERGLEPLKIHPDAYKAEPEENI